jgi:hypothetical protein
MQKLHPLFFISRPASGFLSQDRPAITKMPEQRPIDKL